MRDGTYKPFLEHFLIAAGQAEGDYHGAQWNDGDFYKWLEAAIATWAVTQRRRTWRGNRHLDCRDRRGPARQTATSTRPC